MTTIDLRSDTLTKPTAAMRAAMAEAEVGDDVWGEDPTVERLERTTATLLGKEAALLVPSGTMGNLIGVLVHCGRGDEMIVGDEAHIFYYEVGGASALGGAHVRTVPNRSGAIDPDDVAHALRTENVHFPRTALLCVENTHNRGGGRAIPAAHVRALAGVAHAHGAAVHLDGARLFNAAVALGTTVAELARDADTVNVCFSKGLGAPLGSAIAGSHATIERARKYRKMLGGGMRQVGIVAAAALYALDHNVDRLRDDHDNARLFANELARDGTYDVDVDAVDTNIVMFAPATPALRALGDGAIAEFARAGVLVAPMGGGRARAVTHLDVDRAAVLDAATRLRELAAHAMAGAR